MFDGFSQSISLSLVNRGEILAAFNDLKTAGATVATAAADRLDLNPLPTKIVQNRAHGHVHDLFTGIGNGKLRHTT